MVDKKCVINIFIELCYKMFYYITYESHDRPVKQIFLLCRDWGT